MDTTDDEIIATCLTPEIHKLNEKLTKEHRSQATEAEFLGAFEIAMRNMINQARADEREKAIVKAAEKAGKHAFIPTTKDEIINLLKQPNSQLTMTTSVLQELLQDEGNRARADEKAKLKEQIKLLEAKLHENKIHREHTEQVRHDTAKQIFKELEDNVIHIRGNNEDIRISWSSAKKYFTLKKKYNIEE